jgi:pyruvate/2-oxoglutarate dehydrogenase complex dihydrolipoamide dehydrogenase (E3) component
LLDYYEGALERAGVVVHCGESARAETIDANVVVLAAGPTWDGLNTLTRDATIPVLGAGDALMRLHDITDRVLVVGAGLAGAELAWALSLRAHEVFLVERDDDFDDDVNLIAKVVLSRELRKCRVHVNFSTQFIGACGDTATVLESNVAREFKIDAIVSTIRRPAPFQASMSPGVQRFVVGESAGTRGLLEATHNGYRVASTL